jgi:mitogen-activated protein kinase kinase
MNKFPFPPDGEPPLGPIDLLTYITKMEGPDLEDDLAAGIVYKKAIRDFLRCWCVKPWPRPKC